MFDLQGCHSSSVHLYSDHLPCADHTFLILPAKAEDFRGSCTASSSKPPGDAWGQEGSIGQPCQSLIRTPHFLLVDPSRPVKKPIVCTLFYCY